MRLSEATVPVRELRDELSKYLRLIGQGEPMVVTPHHKPIAVLNSLPGLDEPGLQEMIVRGTVKWNGKGARLQSGRPPPYEAIRWSAGWRIRTETETLFTIR
jgi:antitoxin (DNA-binding transcriptional repressor) of toxin-antitoxin stability system